MHMDPKFNCLDQLIIGTDLNTTAARDHVPEIEWQIKVVKERMQAVHGGLPYDRMTSCMIIYLGKYVVIIINAFPPKSSLARTYIPRTIMTGKQLEFNKHYRRPFGSYFQSHDDSNGTNIMVDQNQGAIFLGLMGNLRGYYAFLLLRTGRKITRSQFT